MSPFSNITNINLAGAAAAKDLMKPGKSGGVKGGGLVAAAGPAVADGLAHSGDIRSAQASLIAKLQQVNQAVNVIQALEGESSALNSMLNKIKSMIKQGSKHLVDGEMNSAKKSFTELVKDLMKGINAPVYEVGKGFNEKGQVLAYIGNGFSIDIVEGAIVFDVNKMMEEVYEDEKEQERQNKKRKDYREAMGYATGGLQKLMESLTVEISKAGGLTFILNDISEASGLSENLIAKIRNESSMLSMSYGEMDAEFVMKLIT
ncbi:MAG: hypothetical protein FVQ82_08065 [Planctomycetes bacterium]|nr:hypothetical protein [Planctomycetota bacterium]